MACYVPCETGSNIQWLPTAWLGRWLCNAVVTCWTAINRTPCRPAPFSAWGLFKKFSNWLKQRTYYILSKAVSLEIVVSCSNTMIPATFLFSSVFHMGLRWMLSRFVVFVLFRLLIQIELLISGTGKGLLETDQGWRVTVNAPESPAPAGNVVTGERRVHGSAVVMMNVLHSLQRSNRLLLHSL